MTIGQQLRRAREARSLSLEQAAQVTRIRLRYLLALESDQFELLPSHAQARGFLRNYAAYLKLDTSPLLAALDSGEPLETPATDDSGAVLPVAETPSSEADTIFQEIGATLSHQRQILGFSIEEVEQQTHIRAHYVQSLEDGDLAGLPSPVQGRGMLKNYSIFLGLDPDSLLLRFADGLQSRLAARQSLAREERPTQPLTPQQVKPISPIRRMFSTDMFIVGALVVFLIVFIGWGWLRVNEMRSAGIVTPTAPSIAEILLASPEATASPEALISSPTATPEAIPVSEVNPPQTTPQDEGTEPEATLEITATVTQQAANQPGLALVVSLVVGQRAWVGVTADGEVKFQGRVMPGSAYTFSGNERIQLSTGNGAALHVYFNQQDLGFLGDFGEAVSIVFTLQGIQTPTATATPIGLPPPTSTEAPTNTPTLSGADTPVTVTPFP